MIVYQYACVRACVCVCVSFLSGLGGSMWDFIEFIPGHCVPFLTFCTRSFRQWNLYLFENFIVDK